MDRIERRGCVRLIVGTLFVLVVLVISCSALPYVSEGIAWTQETFPNAFGPRVGEATRVVLEENASEENASEPIAPAVEPQVPTASLQPKATTETVQIEPNALASAGEPGSARALARELVTVEDIDYTMHYPVPGGFPTDISLHAAVRYPGDVATFLITFEELFEQLEVEELAVTVLRADPDDEWTCFDFVDDGEVVNIMPELGMIYVTENEPSGRVRDYMVSRGMEDMAQQLPQNQYAIELVVSRDDFLVACVKDREDLQVNRGGLIALSLDDDPFTKFWNGEAFAFVESPSIILENDPEYAATPTP